MQIKDSFQATRLDINMICKSILTLFIASNSLAENLYSLLARTIIGRLFVTRDFSKA